MTTGTRVLIGLLSTFLGLALVTVAVLSVWVYRLRQKINTTPAAAEKVTARAKPEPPVEVHTTEPLPGLPKIPRIAAKPRVIPRARPPVVTHAFMKPVAPKINTEPFVDDPRELPMENGLLHSTLPVVSEEEKEEPPLEFPATIAGTEPAHFRVASYNVRCDKDAPPFSWLQRKRHVKQAIIDSGAQIVCLQEARQQYAKELVQSLGPQWQSSGVARRKSDEGTQIAFDSSVFTYIDSSTFVFHDEGIRRCPPHTHCTEPSYLGRRKCAHVRIFTHTVLINNATNAPFNIINTHFPLETFEQDICARQLAEFIEQRTDTTWPVIVCGDLNSHYSPEALDTPLSRLVRGAPGLACAHDMKDFPTYYEGFEHDVLPPGHGYDTVEHSHRLDYVLVRVPEGFPVRVLGGEVLHPRYVGGNGNQYRPSDHEPLVADFEITGQGEWL